MTNPLVALRRASTIQRWRIALVVVGVLLLAVGGLALLTGVSPRRYVGILVWFAGALILHDGIIAPATFGISVLLRKAGHAIPRRRLGVILGILQAAIVVGAIVFLIVFPQIVKQGIGTPNPTVLPLDYTRNLLVFYAAMIAATGAAIVGYLTLSVRRQKLRESIDQD